MTLWPSAGRPARPRLHSCMICLPPHRSVAGFLVLAGLCVGVACGRVETEEPLDNPAPEGNDEDPSEQSPEDPSPPDDEDPPEQRPHDVACPDAAGGTALESPLEVPAAIPDDPVEYVAYATGVFSGESGPIEIPVPFDLRPEATNPLNLKLGSVFDLECGTLEGPFTVESIEVLEGTAQVTQTQEPDVVTIQADEAGESVVEVRGVISAEGGSACSEEAAEVPLVYSLHIQAEEFEWSILLSGNCPLAIASGRDLPLRVVAPDSGSDFSHPMNLLRPSLSLSTSAGVEIQTFDSTSVFYAPFVPSVTAVGSGTVTVSLADGSSSVELRVLAPEELDDVHLEFTLSGIIARGDLNLETGGSYRINGTQPKLDVYARWAGAEGALMCGAPDANDFFITSLTPEVCPVEGRICEAQEGNVRGNLLYDSVPIIENGTCSIRIDAPAYAGGAGISREFSVELENQDLAVD